MRSKRFRAGVTALLAATVDGVAGAEIRVVGPTLYAKAPVADLAKKFGAAGDDVAEIREEATAGTPGVGAFFDGRWVSADLKEAGSSAGLPTRDVDAAKTITELQTSAANLVDGATIVRDAADTKHLVVTSSTTKAYAEIKRLVTAVGGAHGSEITEEIGQAPADRPIVLDLWVDDEKLTAAEVNLLQFVDGAAGRVALRLEVTTGTPISAPENATKIDTSALSGLAGTGPVGAGVDLDDISSDPVLSAGMRGYQAQALAAEAGGKPADHLKKAIAVMGGTAAKAKIVRRGVAEMTFRGAKACLKVPSSLAKEPVVTEGPC